MSKSIAAAARCASPRPPPRIPAKCANPNGLINQAAIQATSWTLKERVGFNRDGIVSRDWQSYPIRQLPRVEVIVLDRPTEKSLGAANRRRVRPRPAIANAVAHATGARVRRLHPVAGAGEGRCFRLRECAERRGGRDAADGEHGQLRRVLANAPISEEGDRIELAA